MGKVCLANAFSLSMIDVPCSVKVTPLDMNQVKDLLANGFVSAIGHQGTADLLSKLLGLNIPFNRIMLKIAPGDKLIVFQLLQRLDLGADLDVDTLKNIKFRFLLVQIQ